MGFFFFLPESDKDIIPRRPISPFKVGSPLFEELNPAISSPASENRNEVTDLLNQVQKMDKRRDMFSMISKTARDKLEKRTLEVAAGNPVIPGIFKCQFRNNYHFLF